ncbi:MAG: LysR family substrate-binding domain-containing protein [Thiohalomonadaceae bacterium]
MSAPASNVSRLRLVISGTGAYPPLARLLSLQRIEEPDLGLSVHETSLGCQIQGLLTGQYDAGLAMCCDELGGLTANPIWEEPLALAVPARSALLAHTRVPLTEALHYPWVQWQSNTCTGINRQLARIFHGVSEPRKVVERVTSADLLMVLVAAGYGIGLAPASMIVACRPLGVVMRPLADVSPKLITYLLRPQAEARDSLSRFAVRATRVGSMRESDLAVVTSPYRK